MHPCLTGSKHATRTLTLHRRPKSCAGKERTSAADEIWKNSEIRKMETGLIRVYDRKRNEIKSARGGHMREPIRINAKTLQSTLNTTDEDRHTKFHNSANFTGGLELEGCCNLMLASCVLCLSCRPQKKKLGVCCRFLLALPFLVDLVDRRNLNS